MKLNPFFLITVISVFIIACTAKTTETIQDMTVKEDKVPEEVVAIESPIIPQIIPLPTLKEKDILMVYGGWQGHKPKEFTDKIATFLREAGATVTTSPSSAVYEDSTFLVSFDLIIQSITMDEISDLGAKNLLNAVKLGKTGFAGCHGGTGDSFRNNTSFQYMVGGQFVSHPGNHIEHTVQITNPNDAITEGLDGFSITTEQYYMHIDPNVKVLATTEFTDEHDDWIGGATMPVVWKKYFGEGRVFYFSIGHDPALFDQVKEAKTILMRGFQWASGSKYVEKEDWLSPMYPINH